MTRGCRAGAIMVGRFEEKYLDGSIAFDRARLFYYVKSREEKSRTLGTRRSLIGGNCL
jgi:hypothetical protein